jgi:cytochrome c oxidase subunit 2
MTRRSVRRGATLAISALLVASCANAKNNQQNTLQPKGKGARDILHLFTPFFWIAVVIGVGVVFATVFFAIRFRERPGNENPRQTHGNTVLEISWTIVPAVIMLVMAVFTVKLIWDRSATHHAGSLEVTVTGKQWWWEYEYTNNGKHVFTANELHIPAGRYVDIELRSDNVIHSFWVPNLNGKEDAFPGHINHMWLKADSDQAGQVFKGQCAQYCGLSHADMGLRVFVDSAANFQKWYQSQLPGWTQVQQAQFQKLIDYAGGSYDCQSCHYIKGLDPAQDRQIEQGKAQPIARGPNLTHLDERSTFAGSKYELTFDNLWQWIYDAPKHTPTDFGKPNTCPKRGPTGSTDPATTPCKVGMPSFRDDPVKPMSPDTAKAIARFLLSIDSGAAQQ